MDVARVSLPSEMKELRDIITATPGSGTLMKALIAMVRVAPDSSLVKEAFRDIDPGPFDDDICKQVAELLTNAEEHAQARAWTDSMTEAQQRASADSNVVDFGTREHIGRPISTGISFDDVGGLEGLKAQMRRKIIKPFLNEGMFQKFKRKAGGGILMYGPPGCGKTMLARALATECRANFINITAAGILDQYVGNAEKRIVEVFKEAREKRPTVLFFDEVEALAQKRQMQARASVNTVVSALLNEMDGFDSDNDGILLLGATNVPWSLDAAFRRPGRFDRTLFVPPPDKVARRFIVESLLVDRPVAPGLNVDKIVTKTSGYSGADMASLVETAVDFAIEESEDAGVLKPVSDSHVDDAFYEVRASTGEWLSEARAMVEYANKDGLYDDLAEFLRKFAR